MAKTSLRIASNFARLSQLQAKDIPFRYTQFREGNFLTSGFYLFFLGWTHHVILLNQASRILLFCCFLRWLFPFFQCPLVSVDLVLTRPENRWSRLVCHVKKFLLRRVDLFAFYFKDLRGYAEFYGITPARSRYVPFKANIYDLAPHVRVASKPGSYVLAAGRSYRDLKTFVAAMGRVSYPGILLVQNPDTLSEHGTEIQSLVLPGNLRLERDDGRWESWLHFLAGAKIVVIPVKSTAITAAGIGTYLEAMALGKCVIITECPATRGILLDQAVIIPPEDPAAMAQAIRRAWEDDLFRHQFAEAGQRYALACGNERRLLLDLLKVCVELVCPDLSSSLQHISTDCREI